MTGELLCITKHSVPRVRHKPTLPHVHTHSHQSLPEISCLWEDEKEGNGVINGAPEGIQSRWAGLCPQETFLLTIGQLCLEQGSGGCSDENDEGDVQMRNDV